MRRNPDMRCLTGYIAVIERDEDGVFIGTVPALKGCHSYGETLDELVANLKEAVDPS